MWKIENDEDSAGGAVFVCKENSATFLNDVLFRTYDEPLADVVVDALNVHEATGLTPSQLQARVAGLEAALRIARMALEKIAAAETEVFDADDTREMVTVAMDDEEMQKIAETALREAF